MDSIFFQILKIDESDEIVVDEDSTILKVQSWKDMISQTNQKEAFHQEGAKKYGKEEWGWDFDEDKPLFDDWKKDEETGKHVVDVGSILSPSQLETRAKHKKTVGLREEFEDDKLDSFDVPIQESPKLGPDKPPYKPPPKKDMSSGTWGLTGLDSDPRATKEDYVLTMNLSKLPLDNIENMLDGNEHKNLSDKEINDELKDLDKKIANYIGAEGRTPTERKTLAELHNRASHLRPIVEAQNADPKRTFPSRPTLEDAKESLGARKTKAQYAKEFKRLQTQHKVDMKVTTKAKTKLRKLEQAISNMEKASERNRRNSRKAKRMYEKKASLEQAQKIRRLYLSMKMTQINENDITDTEKIKPAGIPTSLAELISSSQPSMNKIIRWFYYSQIRNRN